MAVGLPTMLLRPTTTASFPWIGCPVRRISSNTPAGVHGTIVGEPARRRPELTGSKTVDVFGGIDGGEDGLFGNVRRKRQLDEDAVDVVSPSQMAHQLNQLQLRRACGQMVFLGTDAHVGAAPLFHPHVDLGSWVITDQDHGEPGALP